jgi:hypothetical protein
VKAVQELLRHANSRITLDVDTHAVNSHKRAAQSRVVKMMVIWVKREVNLAHAFAPLSNPDWIVTLGRHSF